MSLFKPLTKIEGNQTKILKEQGYKNIEEAKKDFLGKSEKQIYRSLFNQYNTVVHELNKEKEREKERKRQTKDDLKIAEMLVRTSQKEAKKKPKPITKREIKANEILKRLEEEKIQRKKERIKKMEKKARKPYEKKMKTYILHVKTVKIYKKKVSNDSEKMYTNEILIGPYTDDASKANIQVKLDPYYIETSILSQKVVSYQIEYMDSSNLPTNISPWLHPMHSGFILKNNWLSFSKNISSNAYVETENKCVYFQLEKYLKNPPTGRPTVFLNGQRISESSLFEFFKLYGGDDFTIQDGVTTEMIGKLCEAIDRNMYAYNADDKMFYSITTSTSKNYCPIIFYKMNGHLYLLDDSKAIRSVAESNKDNAKKILSGTMEQKESKKSVKLQTKAQVDDAVPEVTNEETVIVTHLASFPLDDVNDLPAGVYILQQNSLNKDLMSYISKYSSIPKVETRENLVVKMSIKNSNGTIISIAVDSNYGKNIDYNMMLHVAEANRIPYVNEGIGSVIHKMLYETEKDTRKQLSKATKDTLLAGNKCSMCNLSCETYEIDHIKPLASGGSNNIENLQILCVDCHKMKTIIENEEGVYKIKDDRESFFNKTVWDNIISSNDFKSYQFVEIVQKSEDVAFKIDQKKCRRNIMLNSKYKWPVYSVMDSPRQFSGIIDCGLYYLNTRVAFPFRGCGWYHEALVIYGLENGLISKRDILLEFKPSTQLANDYFVKPINMLLEKFSCEPSLQKLAVNAYIGLMGRSKITATFSKYTTDHLEASNWYSSSDNYEVFIRNHVLENSETLYEGLFNQKVVQEGTFYCIYSMVLQLEALELHKLETIIKQQGGIILDRNTDAIRYKANKQIDISQFYWDDAKTVIKYQDENPKPLEIEHLPNFVRNHTLKTECFDLDWLIKDDYEGTAEETAEAIIDENMSLHLDGQAGTGKTYLGNCLIEAIKKQNKKYLAFSPTNKGARLIGGATIHSLFYKYNTSNIVFKNILKNVDYIFIDEVSMMIEKFYQLFLMAKRLYPTIKFIVIGDFEQLPPVNDSWTGDYKNSQALFDLCAGNRLQLTKCRRSDDVVFNLYKQVETLDPINFPKVKNTYLNLAYTHKTRIRVNNECMIRYMLEHRGEQKLDIKMNKSNPKTQDIQLMVGMPVIAHKTDKKLNILNSEKFKVVKIEKGMITVGEDNREITIPSVDFNKYFYLGFCITVHASQGETFHDDYTIYDWDQSIFCRRAKYVAISRATKIEDIQMA